MKHSFALGRFVLVIAALFASACVAPFDAEQGQDAEDVSAQAAGTSNALTSNALTSNALTSNALTSNALTSNALTSNALTSNALTREALRDPSARTLLRYIVGCALPAGDLLALEIDGEPYSFHGELGLAPDWATDGGACDGACRSWISGCVLSRVNYLGESVRISVRGDRAELEPDKIELRDFTHREATYYGDIFAERPRYYACLAPGASSIPRVCGPSLDGCVMSIVDHCDVVCDEPDRNGSFPNCRGKAPSASAKRLPGAAPHKGCVTVYTSANP
jgi:hypothetical protein